MIARRAATRALSPLAVGVAAGMFCAGCLRPAEGRTRSDSAVGQGSTTGASVTIEDGLAAIRALAPDGVRLWAQAPVLRVHVSTDASVAASFTVTIDNALTDVDLFATASGTTLPVTALPGDHPTEKRWVLTLPASGSTELVVRPPDADRAEPWRFALLSDIQEAIDRVGDVYARMNEDSLIRFVISSGDLTDTGTLAEFERFQAELTRLHVPFYSTAGNHDISSDEHLFRDMFGRGNFHFVFRQVAFTFVDSASATIDPLAYEWLDGWLEDAKSSVHVVTMHIPPLDPDGERNAAFGSRNEAAKLLERLAAGHVDLTLYGHIHAYYAFANGGIPAYISGGGGAHPERMTGVGRHYVTVDVSPEGVLAAGLVRVDP